MSCLWLLVVFNLPLSVAFGAIHPSNIIKDGIPPKVRVRVEKELDQVIVSGMDLERTLFVSGEKKNYLGKKSIKFNCRNESVSPASSPILLASVVSPTGLVSLKNQKYVGEIRVVTAPSRKRCDVVNEIDMEYYISTLLPKEMHAHWPLEALKAQAVAARTYALHKMSSRRGEPLFDLESSEKHQVSGHFFDSTAKTHRAAMETRGNILMTKNGPMTPAFFHAKCGGKTWRPNHIWDNTVRGYRSVPCPFCKNHGNGDWEEKISWEEFSDFLSWMRKKKILPAEVSIHGQGDIRLLPGSFEASKLHLYVGDRPFLLKKSLLRRYFGRHRIQSNNFTTRIVVNTLRVRGRGKGHGVGMCQFGAFDLAKRGWDHQKILAHYFPGHRVVRVY